MVDSHDTSPALASWEGVCLRDTSALVVQANELEASVSNAVGLLALCRGHADGHTETLKPFIILS
jgi:hypothetical protein